MDFNALRDAHAKYLGEHPNGPCATHVRMSFRDYEELCYLRLIVDGSQHQPIFIKGYVSDLGELSFIIEDREDGVVEVENRPNIVLTPPNTTAYPR